MINMLFVSKCILLSLLDKVPENAAIFHSACAIMYACSSGSLSHINKTLKSFEGVRVSVVEPPFSVHLAHIFGSLCIFFVQPQSIAAFPFMITCYLNLPSINNGNIPLFLLSLLYGVCLAFGSYLTALSCFATLFSLLAYGNVACRATDTTWHYCAAAHTCVAVASCLYIDSEPLNFRSFTISIILACLHVLSNLSASIQLRNLKQDVVVASRLSLLVATVLLPLHFLTQNNRLIVSSSAGYALAVCNLWYYDFKSEWSCISNPLQLEPSHLGVALFIFSVVCEVIGFYFVADSPALFATSI